MPSSLTIAMVGSMFTAVLFTVVLFTVVLFTAVLFTAVLFTVLLFTVLAVYNPLFTHCRTIRRNSKCPPSLVTSGLNRTPVYAAALIKQCLIKKITASSHWVKLIWYKHFR